MRVKLSDEDRERLGAPEWIEYDPLHLTTVDAETLEEAGAPWRAWGTAKVSALRMPVWLAIRKAGGSTPYEDVHFDIGEVTSVESPGKAPSETGDTSTPSRSATSRGKRAGASSRGK